MSIEVPLSDLHGPTGQLDAAAVANYLSVPLAKLAVAPGITYTTLHKTPDSVAAQPALATIKRILVILSEMGLKDEAWGTAIQGRKLNDGLPLSEGYFGYVAGALGRTVEARGLIGELQGRRQREYGPALPIAWTYLGLGENSLRPRKAGDSSGRTRPILGIGNGIPRYDAIRDQARFTRLTRDLKLSTQ